MRYILFTLQGQEHIDAWVNSSAEEKELEIEETRAWFRKYAMAGRITGGEELGWPRDAKTVRKKGVTDGPFAETKEHLGGLIIVEVASEEEAIEMAREWPGLAWDGDAVEVRPVGSSEAQAAEQRGREGWSAPAATLGESNDGPPW
ncbi:MAG TPA: YciI family protein [Candidatus Limnocylindrales bacterium]|nr:YciI family protein [Candidatus Limnocylindrales bacterium]